MKDLLVGIARTPGCRVYPPIGLPQVPSYELPKDLRCFYEACGGVELFMDQGYGLEIVQPSDFVRANLVIRGCPGEDDASHDWFIVAKNESNSAYITIDLSPARIGRCYDSFWDCHATRGGHMPILALTFTEFLRRASACDGNCWYWMLDGFRSYGDAYD